MANTYPYNRNDFYSEDSWQICDAIQRNNQNTMINISFTTTGAATYQNDALIGRTITAIILPVLLQASEYSFDDATGTITFASTPDAGQAALIIYA